MSATDYDSMWATQWDDMKKYGPFARHLRRLIMNMIRPVPFNSVLDVSCGQGALLSDIAVEFPTVELFGTEISMAALDMVKARVPRGQFWPLDLAKGCLDRRFDLVVCSEVLEHIPDDVSAILHLAAMTEKYLIVSSPHGRMRKIEPSVFGHVRNYQRGELKSKLARAGLHVTQTLEWGFPFYSPFYRDLISFLGGKGTTGAYRWGQKIVAQITYAVFMLNSSRRGDEVIVLAER